MTTVESERTLSATADQRVAEYGRDAQRTWAAQFRILLVTFDACVLVAAVIAGYELRFGAVDADVAKRYVAYLAVGGAIAITWLCALQYFGAYDTRHLGAGPEETKRVLRASIAVLSLVAIVCYAAKAPLARGFVIGVIPIGAVLLLAERAAVRRLVEVKRAADQWVHRILAVGTADSVAELIAITERVPAAGLKIVGACVEDGAVGGRLAGRVPIVGGVLSAADLAAELDVDVVAVAHDGLGPTGVRHLGWQLEGSGRGLVLAPSLTEIAGTRVTVSPVEGLPLVWLDQPGLGRIPRLAKRVMDMLGAAVLLVLTAPVLAVVAAAIRLTSEGPVFFRQQRLGANGTEFTILKFRTMYAGAERRRAELMAHNEQDGAGVLFKIRRDPRITPLGRRLRSLSIDELPQLLHVLAGTMSLVGPRPLATEDSTYTGHARRRLLVRPGLTGLWQVSGRSELSWDDAVRLDLFYVENWSVGLDVSILARTAWTVLSRRGAY